MRFVALLPVRDEADIIAECLDHLLVWADSIYVFDTGSVDNTWDIVLDYSARERRISPLGSDPVYFSDTLVRGWLFNKARDKLRDGDWFLRVDADEFHHITPQEFVETRLGKGETVVYHQYYDFCLTASEVASWEVHRENFSDRARPVSQRLRHYVPSIYSEPRLCRYRSSMRWPATASFPYNAGYVARERFPIRHYPHRDPVQLRRRCRLRAAMMANPQNRSVWLRPELHHWAEVDWRKFVMPDDDPGMSYWAPGAPLPEVRQLNHLATPIKRVIQFGLHRSGLPRVIDHIRPRWHEGMYPQKIELPIIQRLQNELSQ